MSDRRQYEIRRYRATPGQMGALLQRFRTHTAAILDRHMIRSVGYWVEHDDPDVLVYLVVHDGDPATNWSGFYADRDWIRAKEESEKAAGCALTTEVRTTMLSPVTGLPPFDSV
ncbi:NIPSNAP family protein [Nocardia nova]|nr:NIPSNAP family protein [Nocardia nova]